MFTFEQWTTDVLQLPETYLDGIAPNATVLYQYMIPSFNSYDGPSNPNIIVSVTDATGHMSNSSSIITVSNGTLTCPEAAGKVDFYIIIPDGSTPSQCRPWSLSWQHVTESPQTMVPPFSIFLLPSQEPPIAIRVPDNIANTRSNGTYVDGTYSFILPIQGNKRFLTTMSDHGPLGSGGVLGLTSPAFDESNTDACLQPAAMDTLARILPSPTRIIPERPTITPVIDGSSMGIPILIDSGGTTTTGYAAYGIADSGAQTIYDTVPGNGGGVGGPLGIGGLIGVVLGAGFVAGVVLATLAWLFIRARRRDRHEYQVQQQKAIAELARLAGKYGGGEGGSANGNSTPGGGPGHAGIGGGNGTSSSNGGSGVYGQPYGLQQRPPRSASTPLTEMRQMFSDASPTEELASSAQSAFGSPQSATRRRIGYPDSTSGGMAAAVGGVMSRLRQGRRGNEHATDSFHSLHSFDPAASTPGLGTPGTAAAAAMIGGYPLSGSHSSTPSMNTAPRTPGGYTTDRSMRRGDGSPTSPISGSGSIPPFHDARARDSTGAAQVGSPSDQSGSWFPDPSVAASSTYNSSRRGGTGTGTGTGTGSATGTRSTRGPTLVQHADAGLIMDDNVYDDEDLPQNVVELPPQYDSLEIRGSQSPTASGSRNPAAGSSSGGNNSAPNSAGPNNLSYSASGSSGGPVGTGGWYPASPTSNSGSGTGGTGTAESDLLMANMGRSASSGPSALGGSRALDSASGVDGSRAWLTGPVPTSSPLSQQYSHDAPSAAASTAPPSSAAPSCVGPGAPAPRPSSSGNEKRPKLKLATPATAAASGLLEDLLRGTGAGPQYSLAPSNDAGGSGAPIAHNHPIDVGEAEPEEWEPIPPEVLRRRGVRRRAPGGGPGTVGPDGGTGGSGATTSTGSGLGSAYSSSSSGGAAAASAAGTTSASSSSPGGHAGGGGVGSAPVVEEAVEEEDEQIPDESEFWIVPRG
ncbi:hypothetical protein OC842_004950 [Tilletia horrida]|uniref:Uncharacterized protein n=1 Tax=Tilletia horrida TaxID=155126 RepID=A0AAN6G8X1_9BASI|nr:hypothetical protein OC842_004950 [Tilletia horrida]